MTAQRCEQPFHCLGRRARLIQAALLLASASLAGCSPDRSAVERTAGDPPAASGSEPAPPDTAATALACVGLERTLLRTPATRARLAAAHGPPDSTRSTTAPNRHVEGVTDSLFTVFYPGLQVDIHKPGGGSDLVSGVVVRDNRYLAEPRIGMGASEQDVVAAIGEPTDREPAALVYDCGVGADQPVRFVLSAGRVSRIEIEYYVD